MREKVTLRERTVEFDLVIQMWPHNKITSNGKKHAKQDFNDLLGTEFLAGEDGING